MALAAAWGYALFAAAAALTLLAGAVFALLALSRAGHARLMRASSWWLFLAACAAYGLAVAALSVFFAYEALMGRIEWHWIVFGPVALAAIVILDAGLYRKLVAKNLPTWHRFRQYIRREDADPAAMRSTLVDEVILQRSLYRSSRVRWLRHTLIFWGFAGMVALELGAVLLREAVPAFGWRDLWREPGHPLRLAFDFAFDLTGLMVLAGCLLALAWRAWLARADERKYADTPSTLFLLFVVLSGFVVEGWRIAPTLGNAAHAASFVGVAFAWPIAALGLEQSALYRPLWVVHAIAACVFIAYVPLKRMVHTCATPMGRLMYSQKGLLDAKRRGVIAAMMRSRTQSPSTSA
jgi:MFS family permease